MQVLKPSELEEFLDSVYILSHSECTVLSYRNAVRKFQRFLNDKYGIGDSTAIQQIKEQRLDYINILKDFVIYYDKLGFKPKSIKLWLTAIKGYLRHCGIKVYTEEVRQMVRVPKQVRTEEKPLTKEILVRLLHVAPLKLQAGILVMIASGIRIGEFVQLKLSDIDFESLPTKISLRGEITKTKEARQTFLTEEATRCLKDYLKRYFGWKEGEKNTTLQETLIFARTSVRRAKKLSKISFFVAKNNFYQSLRIHIKKIPELSVKNENGYNMIHFHAFRKFFRTTVGDAVGRDYAEALMGHHFYMDTYYNLPPEKRREMYLVAEPYLTISDFVHVEKNLKSISEKQIYLEDKVNGLMQILVTNNIKVPDYLLEIKP